MLWTFPSGAGGTAGNMDCMYMAEGHKRKGWNGDHWHFVDELELENTLVTTAVNDLPTPGDRGFNPQKDARTLLSVVSGEEK
jgi:hypothetical protein